MNFTEPSFLQACIEVEAVLANAGTPVLASPKSTIISEGCSDCSTFYVLEGTAKLVHVLPSGDEAIIGVRSRGSFLGFCPGDSDTAGAQVIACTSVRCIRVAPLTFRRLLAQDGSFLASVHRLRLYEYNSCMRQLKLLAMPSGKHRLLSFLVSLSDSGRCYSTMKVTLPLKDWEVAQFLGLTPAHLSRLFAELQRSGMVERSRRAVTLKCRLPEALPRTS